MHGGQLAGWLADVETNDNRAGRRAPALALLFTMEFGINLFDQNHDGSTTTTPALPPHNDALSGCCVPSSLTKSPSFQALKRH